MRLGRPAVSADAPLRVVVAGGGVAALEATLALRALAQEPVSIELIAPDTDFVYRPLAVTEPFSVGETRRFPLEPLVQAAGAILRPGRVISVDPERRVVGIGGDGEVGYDVLLVARGAGGRDRGRSSHRPAEARGAAPARTPVRCRRVSADGRLLSRGLRAGRL